MTLEAMVRRAIWACGAVLMATAAVAADFPSPTEGDWTIRDFRFRSGQVLPELRIHFKTVGNPTGEPVLVLHGTTQSGASMLVPAFGGELFGPGQPLDASRYYVILPDAIGHGRSSKPSDGLRAGFPNYTSEDMVEAQYRLLTEHLGIRRLRAMVGFSMGGMQTWLFAQKYPQLMDVAVPMAALPAEMSGRNWMLRRLVIDSIRKDPQWMNGNYANPLASAGFAAVFYGLATLGGDLGLQKAAPTRQKADAIVDQRLATPLSIDANDLLYQYEASRDYNPSAGLEKIEAQLLAINSADDERNPPALGILEREIKRVKNGRVFMIPATDQTAGHATAFFARTWKKELADVLQATPQGSK